MFQKHNIILLKKKSKSMGHLAALNTPNAKLKTTSPWAVSKKTRGEDNRDSNHVFMKKDTNGDDFNGDDRKNDDIGQLASNVAKVQVLTKTTPKKLKSLVRSKTSHGSPLQTMPSPISMGKAILAKASVQPSRLNGRSVTESVLAEIFGAKDAASIPSKHRTFLMDTQVKYTVGLQCQERNLFLFNDLLLVAKERSSCHFKLKDQIPLSDIWLSTCISVVSEVTLNPATSFVIGWPITNTVITFSFPAQKSVWWQKLKEMIAKERAANAPAATNIQITYFDQDSNFEHMKNVYVGVADTVSDCIRSALKILDIPLSECSNYQLWVRTKTDEAPYPLIGHEIPLIIKLNWMRQTMTHRHRSQSNVFEAEHKHNRQRNQRCSFILRRVGRSSDALGLRDSQNYEAIGKNKLKKVKSSIKLQNVFRRVSHGSTTIPKHACSQSQCELEEPKNGNLFGKPLHDVCLTSSDDSLYLPKCIETMFRLIYVEGSKTVGVFRRSPNARAMREIRDRLDKEVSPELSSSVDLTECSVFVIAALLKEFLRCLPDCILLCERYDEWVKLAFNLEKQSSIEQFTNNDETQRKSNLVQLKQFVLSLPSINILILRHILHILNKIANNSQVNMMTASNLAICVGPSLIWPSNSTRMLEQSYSKNVSSIAQMLIMFYGDIFGQNDMPYAFNVAVVKSSQDSLNKESLNSGSSLPKISKSVLENDLSVYHHHSLSTVSAATVTNQHKSLTNLSRDSGLTTSDSQLYNCDDEISSDEDCVNISNSPMDMSSNKQILHQARYSPTVHTANPTHCRSSITSSKKAAIKKLSLDNSSCGWSDSRINCVPHSVVTICHQKGPAPLPPTESPSSYAMLRSNSVNQMRLLSNAAGGQWYTRSQSSGHFHVGNSVGSTPPISRSNSDEINSNVIGIVSEDDTRPLSPSPCDIPPGYEETISRQRLLKSHHYKRSNSFVVISSPTSPAISSVSVLSSCTSLKIDQVPPLPPKQRLLQRQDDAYMNNGTRIHVTNQQVGLCSPPILPPKETFVTATKFRNISKTRILAASTQTKKMSNAETQTNEADFFATKYDGFDRFVDDGDEENFSGYSSNHSGSPDDSDILQQQRGSCNVKNELFNETRFLCRPNMLNGSSCLLDDPLMTGEINWSVSQLRSLFNNGTSSPVTTKPSSDLDCSLYQMKDCRRSLVRLPSHSLNVHESDEESYV